MSNLEDEEDDIKVDEEKDNVLFKKLRKLINLIDRLRDYMYKERDKELFLESAEQVIKEIFVV